MIELYPHQLELVNDLRRALMKHNSVLACSPVGSGKTVIASYMAQSASVKGKSVIFSVHRKNLIKQTATTFDQFGINYGYIAAGHRPSNRHAVFIASISTLQRRLKKSPVPDLFVIDECHLAMAKTWRIVVDYYKERGTKIVGMSASPARLDNKPLSDIFDFMVKGKSPRWLMDNGFLSKYIAYAPSVPNLDDVHIRMGDYKKNELEVAVDKPKLTGSAITHYKKLANGTKALCYCVSIVHSKNVAEQFNQAGIPAAHLDGTTTQEEQQKVIRQLADGEINVITNVDLITVGFDLSAQVGRDVPIETIILLRPSKSMVFATQAIGRGLRKKPKPCVILDHAGLILTHGLPDDDIEWTLEGRVKSKGKKKEDDGLAIRQCTNCFAVSKIGPPACPICGAPFPVKPREIEEVAGDLKKIDPAEMRRNMKREQGQAKGLDDLIAIGKSRKYKNPYAWANFVYRARKRKGKAA